MASEKVLFDKTKDGRNVSEFVITRPNGESFSVIEYGAAIHTLKVFDKTGENEVTGQIGTGMQVRLIDEYDRNFINIGIAVKGDITGDGNISITDLVKVKGHLLETSILDDVYEAAGDVDAVNGITITDLVNMGKDVTGIEELD